MTRSNGEEINSDWYGQKIYVSVAFSHFAILKPTKMADQDNISESPKTKINLNSTRASSKTSICSKSSMKSRSSFGSNKHSSSRQSISSEKDSAFLGGDYTVYEKLEQSYKQLQLDSSSSIKTVFESLSIDDDVPNNALKRHQSDVSNDGQTKSGIQRLKIISQKYIVCTCF